MKTIVTSSISAIALVCALSAHASAQQGAPDPNAIPGPGPHLEVNQRSGLTFGVGLGIGSLVADCDECRDTMEAGGLNAHVGYMLSPRLAVVIDVWGMAHRESFLTVFQNINTLGVRYWVNPQLWVQGGLGNANAGYEWDGIFVNVEDRTEKAGGVMFGVGYELHVKKGFAIDINFRYGTGFYDEVVGDDYVIEGHSAQLGVGFNWF